MFFILILKEFAVVQTDLSEYILAIPENNPLVEDAVDVGRNFPVQFSILASPH